MVLVSPKSTFTEQAAQVDRIPGYDQIDVSACTERGIKVTNAPVPVTDATADLAVFLPLGALRNRNPAIDLFVLGTGRKVLTLVTIPKERLSVSSDWAVSVKQSSADAYIRSQDHSL